MDAGAILTSWETWDQLPVERSRRWYTVAGALGVFTLLYAIFTANYLFALIVIMFAALMIVQDLKPPRKVMAHITSSGVVFNNELFPFEEIDSFSIAYRPPEVKSLYLRFKKPLQPMLTIPLEEADPILLANQLGIYVDEEVTDNQERLTDTLHRVYKL